jgi:hypothetical protein
MPDHGNDLLGLERAAGIDHVLQQRLTGEFVQHLGSPGRRRE